MTPGSRTDRVADLVAALGAATDTVLVIDGCAVDAETALVESGIANGSIVELVPSRSTAHLGGGVASPDVVAEVACVAGPDCAPWQGLWMGRHVIGRSSSAGICLDDPRVELHHALIEIDEDGLWMTQLTGHVPLRVDGEPIGIAREIVLPAVISIGSSELRFRRAGDVRRIEAVGPHWESPRTDLGTIVEAPNDPWRRVVHRAADHPDRDVAPLIAVPLAATTHRAPPATALIGAAVAVLGAGVIAIVLGQMMFALFAVFGAGASAITWVVGAASAWRSNRRERRRAATDRLRFLADLEREREGARDRRRSAAPAVEDVIATGTAMAQRAVVRSGVWRRRPRGQGSGQGRGEDGGDDSRRTGDLAQFRVVVGRGTSRWNPVFDGDVPVDLASEAERATLLEDVPDAVALTCGDVVTVTGDRAARHSLVRSMLCQLAVMYGPADWQLVVVSADPSAWEWSACLPHSRSAHDRPPIIDPSGECLLATELGAEFDRSRATVLVVDDASLFAVRTGHLRRFIDRTAPLTLTCVGPDGAVPALTCTTIVARATGRVSVSVLEEDPVYADGDLLMCGVSHHRAAQVACALARLVDPEESSLSASNPPANVALSEIEPVLSDSTAAGSSDIERSKAVSAVSRRWQSAGHDPAPRTAIGRSADGLVEVDLVADGPHALIAGTTGAGKSELLRSLVAGLALRHSPEHLTFVLVDYKGGSTFDRCADLPHTVGVVTDLDSGLAERALVSLEAELHRRERLLRAVGATDLAGYRRHVDATVLPRLVVVIDEFAALAKELPDFLAALIGVAQRGRSLGVHLILATQRPAGVVNDDIRANTNLRLALRLNDTSDAHDVVGDVTPAKFARAVPGRSALRLGPGELVVFQAAHCSGPLRRRAAGLRAVASGAGAGAPSGHRDERTELDVAVRIVTEAARDLSIAAPHRPWVDALPDRLTCATVDLVADTVDHGGVGVIDDPAHQCSRVLRWDRDAGSLALVGALGSGTTSTMRAVIAERCRRRTADVEQWYVIDARVELSLDELAELGHVGAVIRLHELERLHRVLNRLVVEIDRRTATTVDDRCVSMAIDGLNSLRTALSSVEHAATLTLLERVLSDGPAVGVMSCWTGAGVSAFRSATAAETWVFRCDNNDVARSAGVAPVESDHPGRLRVASTGHEAHVAVDAGQIAMPSQLQVGDAAAVGPSPVEVLPCRVASREWAGPSGRQTSAGLDLDVGLAYSDLGAASLRVPAGDHVFIGGAASTGKTTALRHIVATWRAVHPSGEVIVVDRRRPLPVDLDDDGTVRVAPILILADDADRVDDADGRLAAIVRSGRPDITVVAAGRLEAVRAAYGHWTRDVARSRCGLILTSAGEVDGDLLGVALPRRTPVPARPGLAWVVDGSGLRLVQVFDAQPLDVLPSNQRGPAPY